MPADSIVARDTREFSGSITSTPAASAAAGARDEDALREFATAAQSFVASDENYRRQLRSRQYGGSPPCVPAAPYWTLAVSSILAAAKLATFPRRFAGLLSDDVMGEFATAVDRQVSQSGGLSLFPPESYFHARDRLVAEWDRLRDSDVSTLALEQELPMPDDAQVVVVGGRLAVLRNRVGRV